jgi:hypothetical protein
MSDQVPYSDSENTDKHSRYKDEDDEDDEEFIARAPKYNQTSGATKKSCKKCTANGRSNVRIGDV